MALSVLNADEGTDEKGLAFNMYFVLLSQSQKILG